MVQTANFQKVKVKGTCLFTNCYTELIQAYTYYNLVYDLGFNISLRPQAELIPDDVRYCLNIVSFETQQN